MEPSYVLTDGERHELHTALRTVDKNPYQDYPDFSGAVGDLIDRGDVPDFLPEVCDRIAGERRAGVSTAHVLRNCPLDTALPVLGHDDPLTDKYASKTTFVAEAFLELVARLLGTPLLAYSTRFNGDFFTDVVAHNKYRGKQTGFSDGELVYHNDRTAHRIRADFIALLGMRCPDRDLVYTCFVEGRDLLAGLHPEEQAVLRQPVFVTPFDVVSRDNNSQLTASEPHPILEREHSFRYLDTHTAVVPGGPEAAKDALIALKNALTRAEKKRHRIRTGDLLTFANQDGLHSRKKIEVVDPDQASDRWLLKTYAFRDRATAGAYTGDWVDGIPGRVGD